MACLQEAIAEFSSKHILELNAALKECKSPYEREQCQAAYARVALGNYDVIGQLHGLPGMIWRVQS